MFELNVSEVDRLIEAIKNFPYDAEEAINEVLHGEGAELLQESITRLMPVSGRKWQGKKKGAKSAKSLKNVTGNLSVTVTTQKSYQYLYFPDDGSNTENHYGNQQFFYRGGEAVQDDIIDRCINRLTRAIDE